MKSKKVRSFVEYNISMGRLSFTVADIEYCVNMAEREADETANQWISIDDKLPTIHQDFIGKTKTPQPWKYRGEFMSSHFLYKRTSEKDEEFLANLKEDEVTHWRSIE